MYLPALSKVYFFDENLPVAPKSLPKPRPAILFPVVAALFLIISVSFLLVLYLMLDSKIVSAQYNIFQLEGSKTKYIERNAVLGMEVQKLSALSRIDNIARKRLGMDMPKERILIEPEILTTTRIPGASAYHQGVPVGIP